MALKNKLLLHHKKITIGVILISIIATFFTPVGETVDKVAEVAPEVLIGVGITESLFIAGLLVMAGTVGFELGANPLKWKQHFHVVAHELPNDKWFWVGFWINAVGALGTGLILAWAIIEVLPPQSWGIIWIPFLDLALTIVIRASVLELRNEYQEK